MRRYDNFLGERIALICHDSGAANSLIYFIKKLKKDVFPSMHGPAKKIWIKNFPENKIYSIKEAICNSDTVLSGTGWGSDIEHNARIKASELGLNSIALIDHWTDYKGRFIRDGIEQLPNTILVCDKYAKAKAKKCFPGINIIEIPNYYLLHESELARRSNFAIKNKSIKHVLIIMEPLRQYLHGNTTSIEFLSIDYFMDNLHKLDISFESTIFRLRRHPSESRNKYSNIIEKYTNMNLAEDVPLHEDIGWSDLVVGLQSFALIVAVKSGVSTVSILPPGAKKCVLPYPEIKSLQEM